MLLIAKNGEFPLFYINYEYFQLNLIKINIFKNESLNKSIIFSHEFKNNSLVLNVNVSI